MMNSQDIDDLAQEDRQIRVTPKERHAMIAVAAYFRAERRAFAPGGAHRDWLEAEAEIDRMLARMAEEGVTRRTYEGEGLRNALRLWAG